MVSMPEDLSGSRNLRDSNTSSSDMFIETKCCMTEESTLALLFVDIKLLVEKTKKKNLYVVDCLCSKYVEVQI